MGLRVLSLYSPGTTTHALGYDPSGNVTQVGGPTYAYEAASRRIEDPSRAMSSRSLPRT